MTTHYADIPIIDRASQIIDCVSNCPQGLSAANLIKQVSIPKTTFYRILNSLVKNNFLTLDDTNGLYYLGSQFNATSMLVDDRLNILRERALPYLQQLVNKVNQTAKLSILSNMDCHVLLKVEGFGNLRISVDEGVAFPLHAGASSKILLSTLGSKGIHHYFERSVEKYTEYTIVTEAGMLRELECIKRDGYAQDQGEYIEGIGAISCPVTDVTGRIIAAVSIVYPILAVNDVKIQDMLAALKESALKISEIW